MSPVEFVICVQDIDSQWRGGGGGGGKLIEQYMVSQCGDEEAY